MAVVIVAIVVIAIITAIRPIVHLVILVATSVCRLRLLRSIIVAALIVGGVWWRGLLSLVGRWREGTLRQPACAVHWSRTSSALASR